MTVALKLLLQAILILVTKNIMIQVIKVKTIQNVITADATI